MRGIVAVPDNLITPDEVWICKEAAFCAWQTVPCESCALSSLAILLLTQQVLKSHVAAEPSWIDALILPKTVLG